MNIKEAQQDMQSSYLGGAPGALISGSIWIIAGIVAVYSTAQTSLITFFLICYSNPRINLSSLYIHVYKLCHLCNVFYLTRGQPMEEVFSQELEILFI